MPSVLCRRRTVAGAHFFAFIHTQLPLISAFTQTLYPVATWKTYQLALKAITLTRELKFPAVSTDRKQ